MERRAARMAACHGPERYVLRHDVGCGGACSREAFPQVGAREGRGSWHGDYRRTEISGGPHDYDTAIAQGLSEAGYILQAVRRLKKEARIFRSGGHRFREGNAEIEKDWTCAPAPLKDDNLHSEVQRAKLPSRVSEPAISRFEHPRLWVQDETDGDEDGKVDQVAPDEGIVGLATATQELCDWKQMQFEGGEASRAIGHELVTDVNASPALGQDCIKAFLRNLTRASILNNHWSPGPGFAGTNPGQPTSKIAAKKRRRPRW
jgi:hypothetical protein